MLSNSIYSMITRLNANRSSTEVRKTVYFPGLNALRYFAAAAVVVCHVEEFKAINLLPTHYDIVYGLGTLAVTFFFVLSGFLITFLLLTEKVKYQNINVRSFYMRRALRIWPVYYLVSILGLFVLPHITSLTIPILSAKVEVQQPINSFLYFVFLPNIALGLKYVIPYASHLWSIGVEEQFYLFWPWIFKSAKRQMMIMVSIIIAFFLMRIYCNYLIINWLGYQEIAKSLYEILDRTRIDCMAVGGIGAFLLHGNFHWFRRYFINFTATTASILFPLLLVVTSINLYYIQHLVFSICFLLFIINISCSERSLFRLEGKIWDFLGNISYSIYMYQYLAIGLVLLAFKKLDALTFTTTYNVLFHLLCQVLVILLAYLSYRFFETPFLKLKKKFTFVQSTTALTTPSYTHSDPKIEIVSQPVPN
jgi:peptidoglycan/LPS O-acetylase OafA/YrhL